MQPKNSPLTLEERKEIFKLIKERKSLTRISSLIGRGKNCVIKEVRINGGRDTYDPEEAHRQSKIRKEESNAKRSEKGMSVPNPYTTMKKRIDNLEMQIDIILEVVKEIRGKND